MQQTLVAVWVTSSSGSDQAHHVNAVVINEAIDPDSIEKVRSLTRCCGVLVTDGTVLDGLPVEGEPLTTADVLALVAETEAHQGVISEAVTDYKRRTRSASVKDPTFLACPNPADYLALEDTPKGRALATANLLAKAWTVWLATDGERRRRTARPKTGQTPWIMPEHLNSPDVDTFPEAFSARVHEQPVV